MVHKEFAVHHSPVLKAAFNSNFIEGQTQTYRLDDISIPAATLLVQWLYFQALIVQEWGRENGTSTARYEEDMALAELWVLGDKLLIPRLQNYTIRLIEQRGESTRTIAIRPFQYIWDDTALESPLRRFAVEQCRYDIQSCCFLDRNLVDSFPRGMLLEVASIAGDKEVLDDDGKRIMSRFDVPEE